MTGKPNDERDATPAISSWSWTCGHDAGSMCARCFMELARRAHELAAENDQLRQALDDERRR